MKRKLKNPAKRAPMPEGYDGVKTKKQQGSPALQGVGGVHKSYYGDIEAQVDSYFHIFSTM
jgi:hypothetical protein